MNSTIGSAPANPAHASTRARTAPGRRDASDTATIGPTVVSTRSRYIVRDGMMDVDRFGRGGIGARRRVPAPDRYRRDEATTRTIHRRPERAATDARNGRPRTDGTPPRFR